MDASDSTSADPLGFPIAAVERDTGLSKDTLRVWERRYGFPQPRRDAHGERLYSPAQIDRLRLLKRLLDQGHRPGRLMALADPDLQALAASLSGTRVGRIDLAMAPEVAPLLELLLAHRIDDLRQAMAQALLRMGVQRWITDLVAPMTAQVGDGWAAGRLQVFEEHLYSDLVQTLLRGAVQAIHVAPGRPRVLLTTLPHEPHVLGLLMAEAIFALDGVRCLSLGAQTPVPDIVRAARAHAADIVGLSCSGVTNSQQLRDSLALLHAQLPPGTELWVGGQSVALQRRPPPHVRLLPQLDGIAPALADWRAARPGGNGDSA